jgi:YbbR domain-containing protein
VRLLKWLAALFYVNFLWKLLALAIAFGLWAFVATEPELSTFSTAKVEYRNIPEDLEIASQPLETVTLELRGPARELRALADSDRPAVVLNMANAVPGERTFPIDAGNVRMARGIELIRSIPAQVRFTFERLAMRTVPVRVRFTGEGSDGYVIGRYSATPDHVGISGPAGHVGRISSVSTDTISVASTVGTSEFHVNAFVDDPFVHLLESPAVSVSVTMKKK